MLNGTRNISDSDVIFTNNLFVVSISVTPDVWIIHLGAVLTYFVIASNSIIIPAFLKKEVASPSTLLLAGLALTDEISAISLFLPKHLGFLTGQIEYGKDYNETVLILSRYPYCRFLFWLDSILISAFHAMSLIFTTLLAVQKSLAIRFPIHSKRFLTKKSSFIAILITMFVNFAIFVPYGLMFNFHEENGFCILSYESWVFDIFFQYIFYFASSIYIFAVVVLALCSIYISCKLTGCSTGVQRNMTSQVTQVHRRSATIVVFIVVIFLISEFLTILCMFQVTFTNSHWLCDNPVYDFSDFTLVLGFAANYFVYIAMSRQLRSVLTKHFLVCCPCRRCNCGRKKSVSIKNESHAMGDRF